MSCNCIEEFNKLLVERTGDPEAFVNVIWSFSAMSVTRPKMSCTYRGKKKDGTFMKAKDHSISGEYCHFCGTRYEEEAALERKERA